MQNTEQDLKAAARIIAVELMNYIAHDSGAINRVEKSPVTPIWVAKVANRVDVLLPAMLEAIALPTSDEPTPIASLPAYAGVTEVLEEFFAHICATPPAPPTP